MSRIAWLLTALAGILLGVLWFFLLWSPTSQTIDEVRADVEATQQRAEETRQRAAELRAVRDSAPEAAATLARADVLIPPSASLPALLRQLQSAADAAGVRLESVSPGRPSVLEGAPGGLAVMPLTVTLEGSFYQVVDVARRLEDPSLVGRGLMWETIRISESDYPTLSVQLSAQVFARLDEPVPDAPADDGGGEGGTEDEPEPPASGEEDLL